MTALDRITERVHTRRERSVHHEVQMLPPPQSLGETCIVGYVSIYGMETKQRIVKKSALLSVNGYGETPSAIARDYLTNEYGKGPPISHDQYVRLLAGYHEPPLYARPGQTDEGFYVDIKRAYFSIMQIAGWNVDYYPGRWICSGRPPFDFPFQDSSVSRNSLVSAGQGGNMTIYKPGWKHPKQVKGGNRLANRQVVGLVNDVIRAIAWEAREAGAVYIGTDGYIAPDTRTAEAICQIVYDWGLIPRIEAAGHSEIYGPGSYVVGEKRTKHRLHPPRGIDNMKEVEYGKWLQQNFTHLTQLQGDSGD